MSSHICQRLNLPGKWQQGVVNLYRWRPRRDEGHRVTLGSYLCGKLFIILCNKDLGLDPLEKLCGRYGILQPFTDVTFQRWKTYSEELMSTEETENELLETSMLLH